MSCGTMITGVTSPVSISTPYTDQGSVKIDGIDMGRGSFIANLHRDRDHQIEYISTDGVQTRTVTRHFNWLTLFNVLNFGVGFIVDYTNGSFWELDQGQLSFNNQAN
jgi:hypothetical protein